MNKYISKKELIKAEISTAEYVRDFVNVEEFKSKCEGCSSYGKLWCCPPFDFNILDYWRSYDTLYIYAHVIYFSKEALDASFSSEEINTVLNTIYEEEKETLSEKLFSMEDEFSISLSAGKCQKCKPCTRTLGLPCTSKVGVRYSFESLCANVGLTCFKLLHKAPKWSEEGKLPSYMIIVSGLLRRNS